jgi:CO/xanthine dehydrogenase FAD-binding subunit
MKSSTELIVPIRRRKPRTYLKFISRSSEDRPCVGMAVVLESESDGTCKDLRLVAGAVAEIPQEIVAAEALAHWQAFDR